MNLPIRKTIQRAKKREPEPNPDAARIQRELAYAKRVGANNPRLAKLRKRISERKRRSYGR